MHFRILSVFLLFAIALAFCGAQITSAEETEYPFTDSQETIQNPDHSLTSGNFLVTSDEFQDEETTDEIITSPSNVFSETDKVTSISDDHFTSSSETSIKPMMSTEFYTETLNLDMELSFKDLVFTPDLEDRETSEYKKMEQMSVNLVRNATKKMNIENVEIHVNKFQKGSIIVYFYLIINRAEIINTPKENFTETLWRAIETERNQTYVNKLSMNLLESRTTSSPTTTASLTTNDSTSSPTTTESLTTNDSTSSPTTSTSLTTKVPAASISQIMDLSTTRKIKINSRTKLFEFSFELSFKDMVFNSNFNNRHSIEYIEIETLSVNLVRKATERLNIEISEISVIKFRKGSIIAQLHLAVLLEATGLITEDNFLDLLSKIIQIERKEIAINKLRTTSAGNDTTLPLTTDSSLTTNTSPASNVNASQIIHHSYSLKITFFDHKWNSGLENKNNSEYEKRILAYTIRMKKAHVSANYALEKITIRRLEKGSVIAYVVVVLSIDSNQFFDLQNYLLQIQNALQNSDSQVLVEIYNSDGSNTTVLVSGSWTLSKWAIALIVIVCIAVVIITTVLVIKIKQVQKDKTTLLNVKKEFDDMLLEGQFYSVNVYPNEAYDHAYDLP